MGYEVYQPPFDSIVKNYGPVRMFICEDPDGNQVEFIALPSAETVKAFRADPANKS
jgi:lactoylglutathione lyase